MIMTVTLNPSIDKRYVIDNFKEGSVMRVTTCEYTAGGKGINLTKNLHILGANAVVTGVVGGFAGEYIINYLKKMGIKTTFTKVLGETRSCVNLFDSEKGVQSEFLEPGETISEAEIQEFFEVYKTAIDGVNVITMSGSALKGFPYNIYAQLIEIAKNNGIKTILDVSGKYLIEGVKAKPFMIKPNIDEIQQLVGKILKDENEIIEAIKELNKDIQLVVVSLGKDGSIIGHNKNIYKVFSPDIKTVNTVGCGDALSAGYAYGINLNFSFEEMAKRATAVATSNAMNEKTGYFEMDDYNAILPQIKLVRIC